MKGQVAILLDGIPTEDDAHKKFYPQRIAHNERK